MPPVNRPRPKGLLTPRGLVVFAALICLVFAAYGLKESVDRVFWRRPRVDATTLNSAVSDACSRIEPVNISTTTVTIGGCRIRHDYLELSRNSSLSRANLEITRAVEKAGGHIVYGIDSSDRRRRREGVTLGISDGDSLIREVKIEKRVR